MRNEPVSWVAETGSLCGQYAEDDGIQLNDLRIKASEQRPGVIRTLLCPRRRIYGMLLRA